jgi:MFS family permease
MGIYGVGVILAPALGPALGGLLIDNYSWRYVFFLGPPFCVGGLLLAPIFLATTTHHDPQPFDWPGFVLLSTAIATLLTALANGQRLGWDSGLVEGCAMAAGLSAVAFVYRERQTASPILAMEVYLNPRFLAASVVAFILGLGLYGSTYLVPLFVQTIQGYSPTESGLLLMPAGIALGVIFPLAGRLSDRLPAWPDPGRAGPVLRLQCPDVGRRHLHRLLDPGRLGGRRSHRPGLHPAVLEFRRAACA